MDQLTCKTTGMTRRELDDAVERARSKWTLTIPGSPECEAASAELSKVYILLRRLNARIRRAGC